MLAIYQSKDAILTFQKDVENNSFILRLRKDGQPEGEATQLEMKGHSAISLGEIFTKHGKYATAQEEKT